MEERKFRYDAFISYRHTELDKFVAENLIKELESYKLPKNVAKKLKGKKTKIERVFRDREELPLTNNLEEPIVEALQNSEWLIVICSPRLPESVWCKKEIETFISLRGRDHVLAVLIEGEPSESFPEELLYKVQEVTLEDGTTQQVKVPVEPLAADFRGDGKKGVAKAMKTEKLRLLAAMFGVPFDDLRQRHKERRLRRIATISGIVGAACLLFGVYCAFTAMRIQKQKEQIEEQSNQILAQSDEILKQNEEIKSKSEEILLQNQEIQEQNDELALKQAMALAEQAERYLAEGNRDAAVQTALEALTESDGVAMPYTTEAEVILAESLRAYDIGQVYRAEYQYLAPGRVDYMEESYDLDTLAISDDSGLITLLDAESYEVIEEFSNIELYMNGDRQQAFLGEDRFVYINDAYDLCIYNMSSKEIEKVITDDSCFAVYTEPGGKYILTDGSGSYYNVYDGATYEKISSTPTIEGFSGTNDPYIFEDGIMLYSSAEQVAEGEYNETLHFVDVNTMEVIAECPIGNKVLKKIKLENDVAYMLLGEYAAGYMDCNTYTVAFSLESGEILWENVQMSQYPKALQLPGVENSDIMLSASGNAFQLIQMQTGEVIGVTYLAADIISVYAYKDNANYLIFCEDGSMHLMGVVQNLCVDMSDRFECVTTGNDNILRLSKGIAALQGRDNIVTFYTAKQAPAVKELSETVERTVYVTELSPEKAYEVAEEYGMENPEYIKRVFYSDDEKYCFVDYWNNTLVIYKVGVGICSTIENVMHVDGYIGAGSNGYSYLLCSTGCYMLNFDMKPIAWIDQVKDVDVENNVLYMKQSLYSFSSPIYTTDELIQMAKEWQ